MDKNETSAIEKRWKKLQEQLGFTDGELAFFRSSPKHVKAMETAPAFATHRIIIEVIEAHNCAAGYKTGDKFVVDGGGFLVLRECPTKLCVGAIASFKVLIDRMWQAFFDGCTDVLHDTVHCPDVGVHRGGWGEITMRVHSIATNK